MLFNKKILTQRNKQEYVISSSQQINESVAEISVRRLAIIIQIQIQNWPN